MSALSKKLRLAEGPILHFWCPGCEMAHGIRVAPSPEPWGYNGNPDKPTFTPSVLVTGRDFTAKGEADYKAWLAAGKPQPTPTFESADSVCHSYITDGRIQFLGDCTHALANQTVDLPDWAGEGDELSLKSLAG